MSWFGPDVKVLLQSDVDCIVADEELDVEVADGVVMERRTVLWLSAAAVASVLTGVRLPGMQDPVAKQDGKKVAKKPQPGSFRAFLDEIYPLSKKVIASGGKGEEAYLMMVAVAMTRLKDPGANMREQMRAFIREQRAAEGQGGQRGGSERRGGERRGGEREGDRRRGRGRARRRRRNRFPLSATTMNLKPGRGFSHHDHRDYNGVILGVGGEVRIRNFDILGKDPVPPRGKTFQIRETRNDLILPGRFSTLGQKRENVHELVAGPEGAKVLDVFTFFKGNARSYMMDVGPKPRDAKKRVYDAAWR